MKNDGNLSYSYSVCLIEEFQYLEVMNQPLMYIVEYRLFNVYNLRFVILR